MMRARALVAGALTLVSIGASAQTPRSEGPGRGARISPARALCPAARLAAAPTDAQRRAARELAQRGQQAAILGDRASAREQLRQAAALDPSDPDLAYQLARAHEGAGASADAAIEYCRFLVLAPDAPEAAEARDRVAILSPPARAAMPEPALLSPGRALSLGLIVPGAGQFYTGRPVGGVLAFSAASLAVACGLSQRTTATTVQETALDPFGNSYIYTTTRQTSSRPCLVPGLAAAGAIAVASAVEAFRYSRRTNDERRLALDVVPAGNALALRLTVR